VENEKGIDWAIRS